MRVVASRTPGEIVCIAVIPGDHPLVEHGRAPCLLAIEAAAQAAAASRALEPRDASGERGAPGPPVEAAAAPRIGYLVGVREAAIHRADLPAGWPLRVTVRPVGSAPPLAVYEATVEIDGETALTATFSTYLRAEETSAGAPGSIPA